jgi:hypothetical protein
MGVDATSAEQGIRIENATATPPKTELTPKTQQAIERLAQRVSSPLIHLLTDEIQGQNNPNYSSLFDGGGHRLNDYFIGTSPGIRYNYNHEEAYTLQTEEASALQAVFDAQGVRRDQYLNSIIQSSPSMLSMIQCVRSLTQPRPSGTSSTTSNPHAEARAREEMTIKYGGKFEQMIPTNPTIRNEYLRKVQYVDQAPSSQKRLIPPTEEEQIARLDDEINFQRKELFIDLVSKGIPLYFKAATEFNNDRQTRPPSGFQRLTTKIAEQLTIKGEVTRLNGERILFCTEDDVKGDIEPYPTYMNGIRFVTPFSLVCHEFLRKADSVTPQQTQDLFEFLGREDMIYDLEELREKLDNYQKNPEDHEVVTIRPAKPFRQLLENLHSDINTNTFIFNRIDAMAVAQYAMWQSILHGETLKKLSADPEKEAENPQMKIVKALGQVFDIVKASAANKEISPSSDVIPHHFNEPTANSVVPLTEILRQQEELRIKPHFVIKGDPWNHMGALRRLDELSTYPNLPNLPFKQYDLPQDGDENDQLFITAMRTIQPGQDSDGVFSGRVFTPEHAKLTSVAVTLGEEHLSLGSDYVLQYENKSGHYRIVLTDIGLDKVRRSREGFTYTVGIHPDQSHNGTPPQITALAFSEREKISEFANMLHEQGYSAIAGQLDTLVQSKKGKITTKDLEKALKQGARYTFSLEPHDGEESFSIDRDTLTYLPSPDAEGKATIQCAHAAQLYSDLLNYMTGEDMFYPSTMLHTVQMGFGHVFAGAPHADLRGNMQVVRLRHDSTPTPTKEDYSAGTVHGRDDANTRDILAQVEARQAALVQEIGLHIAEKNLPEIAKDVSKEYIKKVLDATPKDKHGKILMSTAYPPAVTQIGEALHKIEQEGAQILHNPEKKAEIITALITARKNWMLSFNDVSQSNPAVRTARERMFGNFSSLAGFSISSIDRVLTLLQAA